MGFWSFTKRMLQGKPAFEAPQHAGAPDKAQDGLVDEHGHKHPPTITLTHAKSDHSGEHVDVWVTIKNQSERDVMLDKLVMLGVTARLGYPLPAGHQHEFRAYRGPSLTHDHYHRAELYYKDVPSGDYFRADHLITYHYEAVGSYDVTGFELIEPIYDV